MKKIITLLMMGMLAFGIFASATTLDITATVAKINPTYSVTGSILYGKNTGKEASTTTTTTGTVTVEEGKNGKLTALNARFTKSTEYNSVDKDDDTFIIKVSLLQTEARWTAPVTVKFDFSEIKYSKGVADNQSDDPEGVFTTGKPSKITAKLRDTTVALAVTGGAESTSGDYTATLTYSPFGYFIKSGAEIVSLTATYDIPAWDDENSETTTNGYMPFGTYTGTVTVTISGN